MWISGCKKSSILAPALWCVSRLFLPDTQSQFALTLACMLLSACVRLVWCVLAVLTVFA